MYIIAPIYFEATRYTSSYPLRAILVEQMPKLG